MSNFSGKRPAFPKRAVVTGGMPYGNKELHFGHIGGVFVHADVFTRFLKARIGEDNVIFVSGTDCYGSASVEKFRELAQNGYKGTVQDFVRGNHDKQKATLAKYLVEPTLYAGSSLDRAGEIHKEVSAEIVDILHKKGVIFKTNTLQFFDAKNGVFLNGRQVVGRCPINGCKSEQGYADECALGHQYSPSELIMPKSTLSGAVPELRNVENWYYDLEKAAPFLNNLIEERENDGFTRKFVTQICREFLRAPSLYVKKDCEEQVRGLLGPLIKNIETEAGKDSIKIEFENLAEREEACKILSVPGYGRMGEWPHLRKLSSEVWSAPLVRYRTGKTLVPLRLSGNIDWGVPFPEIDGTKGLTFWVWPESLWAPISFTQTALENMGRSREDWKKFWCDKDATVFQWIGEDNIYFYDVAQMGMFEDCKSSGKVKNGWDIVPTKIIANKHLGYLDAKTKASSSGAIRPPMADELLSHYEAEQLRAHFFGMALHVGSVAFSPKPYNPSAAKEHVDPVLKEWNIFANLLNRAVRTLFYSFQKYNGGDARIPQGKVSADVKKLADETILKYEELMARAEFSSTMNLLEEFFREVNKRVSELANALGQGEMIEQQKALAKFVIDSVHLIKTAAALAHPIAPASCDVVREYLGVDKRLFSWDHIFDEIAAIAPQNHKLKFAPPKFDFFKKPEWQFGK